jgi:hypothetical protein
MSDFTSFVKRIGCRIPDTNLRREVEDELLDHLEAAALGLHARGLSLEDARVLAMQQFGDPDEIGKEFGRVHNGIKWCGKWKRRTMFSVSRWLTPTGVAQYVGVQQQVADRLLGA